MFIVNKKKRYVQTQTSPPNRSMLIQTELKVMTPSLRMSGKIEARDTTILNNWLHYLYKLPLLICKKFKSYTCTMSL